MTTATDNDQQISYSVRQAAAKTGYSESSVRRAIDGGYLVTSRAGGMEKAVILHDHLMQWLKAGE